MQNLLDVLKARGLIDQITHPELKEHLQSPRKIYVGFDPTASSLHLGNLVGIILLSWCQRFGHVPCAVLGGATGRIGDPSGKSKERPLLSEEELDGNIGEIRAFFLNLFGDQISLFDNYDWMGSVSFIDFLRDIGKYFRLGPMLSKESVKARLHSEEGLSFTEFSYQVLQGYDFYYLHEKESVSIQMGGSDQWGNITAGIELNRKLGKKPVYGLTFPLLTRSDGKKFGKSEEGAIWLSDKMLTPYQFYQYLYRIPDADVICLLKMLTFLPLEEIAEIESKMAQNPNSAQKRLAEEVTRFVHKEEGLQAALKVTESIAPGAKFSSENLEAIKQDMPSVSLKKTEVLGQLYTEIAKLSGLVSSKAEALRLIQNQGAYLNDEKVSDPKHVLSEKDLVQGSCLLLGSGKKKKLLLHLY